MKYHEGERAVQERAGVSAGAAKIGRSVDDEIAPAAAHFLAQRFTLFVGSLDAAGRPWASELVGPRGFVRVTDPRTVEIDATPGAGDPLSENLRVDPHVGLLAIDLATRRRFRVNGSAELAAGTLRVRVVEAYGNCPKYIQRREPKSVEKPVETGAGEPRVTRHTALTPEEDARIASADTFFLATAHPTAGADVSHRGGRPGFVHVEAPDRIVWPDYQGNTMFMSLGNIAANPRAGLLFVDFATGDVLQVTGRATIDWSAERAARFPGAERVVELGVDEVVDRPGASPLRWRLVEPSPVNP
jgi:predicted pyridoxine 5'-phosphate oxidase superfamily flavin-nucleotide-binding protein